MAKRKWLVFTTKKYEAMENQLIKTLEKQLANEQEMVKRTFSELLARKRARALRAKEKVGAVVGIKG